MISTGQRVGLRSLIACLCISLLNLYSGGLLATEHRITNPVFKGEVFLYEFGEPDKPTIVLVHGLGESAADDWLPTIDELRTDYHIIAMDLPGFGRSSRDNTVYSPTKYARLIHYFAEQYVEGSFHLVGHSMGGAISLRYAAMYPDDLLSLTLVDAAGVLHRLAYSKYLAPFGLEMFSGRGVPAKRSISDLAGVLMGLVEEVLPVDPDVILHSSVLRSTVLKNNPTAIAGLGLVLEDFSEVPQQVRTPTLIIWGEEDEVAPLRTGKVLDELISASVLRTIPGAGHVPIKQNLDIYIGLLQEHLRAPGEMTNEQQVVLTGQVHNEIICRNTNGKVYTGRIKRLVINNCRGVKVVNAEIERLEIDSSNVQIENTILRSDGNPLFAANSWVEITNGSINGDVAIRSAGSDFDIAGTLIEGRVGVYAVSQSQFVMSLVRMRKTGQPLTMIHGLQPQQYSFSL